MTQRLFQDAAGTIPAILAGQPVGLSIRAAGQQNATQATALSKPTLSRWPMTGRRNLANGAQAVGDDYYWRNSAPSSGVTQTNVGQGVEDGIPYVDIQFTGEANSVTITGAFQSQHSRITKVEGRQSNARLTAKIISGAIPGGMGLRAEVIETNAGGGFVTASTGNIVASGQYQVSNVARTEASENSATQTGVRVTLTVAVGTVLNVTYRIKGLQWEIGSAQTPLQFNYGPNDITEPGVADLWHLYNDGGDSLNVILPAGTYGSAHLAIDRSYNVGSVVSDGVTPLTTLTTERQIDAIYRLGEFSAGEREALIKYWQEEYPL